MTYYQISYVLSAREQMDELNERVEEALTAIGLTVLDFDSSVPYPEDDPDEANGEAVFLVRDDGSRIEYAVVTLSRLMERPVLVEPQQDAWAGRYPEEQSDGDYPAPTWNDTWEDNMNTSSHIGFSVFEE